MMRMGLSVLLVFALPGSALSDSNVQVSAGFETGRIQPNGSSVDGFHTMAAPDPQSGTTIYATGKGGFGPSTSYDVRVVESAKLGGVNVLPRRGNYFMLHQVFRSKDYSKWNGNGGKDKARTDTALGKDNKLKFDVEYWLGFSIYTPADFEHEEGVADHRGSAMLLTLYTTSRPDETFFNFSVRPKKGSKHSHWYLNYFVNPDSVEESGIIRTDIGSNKDDIGRWTDFVMRFRSNPFDKDTNPAKRGIRGAADRMFRANKGILQVWKSTGTKEDSKGGRPMKLVFDIENAPVGNVPSKENELIQSFRIYKYAWRNYPSTVKGPVRFGFDEIRFGSTTEHGTSYADVHPLGMHCTHRCPEGQEVVAQPLRPMPPELTDVALAQ